MPFRAQGVNLAIGDGGGTARAGRVGDGVLDRVFMQPELFAGGLVQAQGPLGAGEGATGEIVHLDIVFGHIVGGEDLAASHGRA